MTASKNKKYSNAYYKRPTMSVLEGAALAKERNKKKEARKKEIEEKHKKYKVGGGWADRYGPHKVDVNRQATEALFGTGPLLRSTREKLIKFGDKVNKKLEERREKKKKKK